MFLVWLGELITERGIGNGVSIIIFGGIIAQLPATVGGGFMAGGQVNWGGIGGFHGVSLITIVLIVIFHRGTPAHTGAICPDGIQGRQNVQAGRLHLCSFEG